MKNFIANLIEMIKEEHNTGDPIKNHHYVTNGWIDPETANEIFRIINGLYPTNNIIITSKASGTQYGFVPQRI